jgi:hypothetical protein
VAKAISTLTWLEKAISRGDISSDLSENDFINLFEYQRVHNYFKSNTNIEYVGSRLRIKYNKGSRPLIQKDEQLKYELPKIMYVPAERNFLSTIENPFSIKNLPDTLRTFAEELRKSQLKFKNKFLSLPIGDTKYEYNESKDTSSLIGSGFEVNMLEASSGFQSFVPLYLVTMFLSDELQEMRELIKKDDIERAAKTFLTIDQNRRRTEEITKSSYNSGIINDKYFNNCFINIVEEPEQNLFPSSQWEMLQSLLVFNNKNTANKLIITTHSPYIINYITLTVKAGEIKKKACNNAVKDNLQKIVSLNATINSDDLIIYELDENKGTIIKLGNYKGLPSDENYLNDGLERSNDLFVELLKIEDQCQ